MAGWVGGACGGKAGSGGAAGAAWGGGCGEAAAGCGAAAARAAAGAFIALDQVAFLDPGFFCDLLAVDADPVVGAQVLDEEISVLLEQPCVPARDVALGEPDGVAILTADGDLFADHWDDCLSTLVVLDDELH
jgi:hypothetical protein